MSTPENNLPLTSHKRSRESDERKFYHDKELRAYYIRNIKPSALEATRNSLGLTGIKFEQRNYKTYIFDDSDNENHEQAYKNWETACNTGKRVRGRKIKGCFAVEEEEESVVDAIVAECQAPGSESNQLPPITALLDVPYETNPQIATLTKEKEELLKENQILNQKLQFLSGQSDKASRELTTSQISTLESKKQIETLQASNQNLTKMNIELTKNNGTLRETNGQLTKTNEEQAKQMEELKKELKESKEASELLKISFQRQFGKSQESEKTNIELEKTNTKLEKNNTELLKTNREQAKLIEQLIAVHNGVLQTHMNNFFHTHNSRQLLQNLERQFIELTKDSENNVPADGINKSY